MIPTHKTFLLSLLLLAVFIFAVSAEDSIVYVTKTGKAYHSACCSSLGSYKIPVPLSEAIYSGYTPHSRCKPPTETDAPPPGYDIEPLALPHCENPDQIIRYKGFALLYDEDHEQASWVAYLLTKDEEAGSLERPNNFRPDVNIETGSAEQDDYDDKQYIEESGAEPKKYSRGHLAPDADMDWDFLAVSQTYLFSNMSPQVPRFNSGIWAELEEWVRDEVVANEELYVVTGPVLTDGPYETIGDNQVTVPKRYYKVVFDYKEPEFKAIGFILPHEPSSLQIETYAMPVRQVEQITELNFFHSLPDEIEESLESTLDLGLWLF